MQRVTHSHGDPAAEQAWQALVRRRKAILRRDDERDYELSSRSGHTCQDPMEREEENAAAALLGLLTPEEQRELVEIEAELEAIKRGGWGICGACGHAIGHQLLRAMPERRVCLACERK